jgi:hypothetical protein
LPSPEDRVEPSLGIEPDVIQAPAIVPAVDHDGQSFHLRLHAGGGAGVVDDRARAVLLQLLVDVPDATPALVAVGDLGLRDELFLELGVSNNRCSCAPSRSGNPRRTVVGVVDTASGVVKADLVILAGELGKLVGGLDRLELAIDADLLELIDQDGRRVAVGRDVARGGFNRQPLVGSVAEPLNDCARLGAVLGDVGL